MRRFPYLLALDVLALVGGGRAGLNALPRLVVAHVGGRAGVVAAAVGGLHVHALAVDAGRAVLQFSGGNMGGSV